MRHEFHESARRLKPEFVNLRGIRVFLLSLIRVYPCPSVVSNFVLSSNARIQSSFLLPIDLSPQPAMSYNTHMETLDEIKARAEAAVPGAQLQIIANDSPSAQTSLLVDSPHAVAVAKFLRDDARLCLDFASNVTGVDWPERIEKTKTKVKKLVEGVEKEVEETTEKTIPGYLEVVYHLYSMEKKHGPVILRLRTGNRTDSVTVPSLTSLWRGCELQEREVFDLYGVQFEGHPDLRRILMWDEFKDHPMRKDYVEPNDYEYEPTPHDEVLERAKANQTPGIV